MKRAESEIYIQRFPGPGTRARVSTDGGALARWAHSGKELFYLAPDRRLMRVAINAQDPGRAPQIGQPSALFTTSLDPAVYGLRQPYAVSNDDQRFLMITSLDPSVPGSIAVVLNWAGK